MSHYADIDRREFVKTLDRVSQRYNVMDVFADFCAVAACAVECMTNCVREREERYESVIGKYRPDERNEFRNLFRLLVDGLTHSRESFLGPVLEDIGAANTRNGQFLTPPDVANMMAEITVDEKAARHVRGELMTINDPACGGGVTLIACAEALMRRGVPQRDIMIYGGDIDGRACDMTFVELSLLGYAARIDHMNALTMEALSRPRWTFCYSVYGTYLKENLRIHNHQKRSQE